MALYHGYASLPCGEKTDSAVFAPGLENVDAYYALLKSRQVPLLGEPPNRPERGTRRYFRDPEGYLFAMAGPMGYIFV